LYPSWSPDGKIIAFSQNEGIGQASITLIDADGSNQRRLVTLNSPINGRVVWSPDGKQVAYTASPDGIDDNLYVLRVDGSEPPREIEQHILGGQIEWLLDGAN